MFEAPVIPEAQALPGNKPMPLTVRGLMLELGGARVLHDLNLDLGPAGCTMIMGANGAGKSLLLKLLHGLMAPTAGTIEWAGTPAAQATKQQALVFQKPVLLRRSVAANVDFVLKARGKNRSKRDALLDHVGLAHKAKQPARLLSGGEAQRLALARALATDPDVLFLDEPTASLDPASVLAIEGIVSEAKARGTRVIFVTHDMGQAQRMADDVVFLHGGHVIEHSPADTFFPKPQTQAARDYLQGRIIV
ncbi:ATP-binding cassette domain-containing protein [uncultured Roseovarius sp.]|uniref:ATP-binding cassette domain-containing protein n=1 Tax=uncultured Roseovarius sp. TaxID=293344 RepID=UPI0025E721D3|nr:ATP-binding cassette domain-containing protein [uncultured Roseovarius sp.]